jgi:hypothetical protein
MRLPAQYRITRNSLEKMTKIDPVAKIRNKAIAMEVYAYQAKDKELISYSTEIKRLATRRIGKLMEEQRVAGKLAKGTKGSFAGKKKGTAKGRGKAKAVSGGAAKTPPETLADQGVDKALAKAAREAAAMSEEKFAANTARAVAVAAASVDGDREVIKAARAENHKKQQAKRAERESDLATKIAALPSKKYGVIYADPEWRFELIPRLVRFAGKNVRSPRKCKGPARGNIQDHEIAREIIDDADPEKCRSRRENCETRWNALQCLLAGGNSSGWFGGLSIRISRFPFPLALLDRDRQLFYPLFVP